MDLKKFVDFERLEIAFEAKSDIELKKRYFIFSTMKYPWMVKIGTTMTRLSLGLHLPVQGLIKSTIFDIFCGGVDLQDCEAASNELGKFKMGAIFDYSVEGEKTEAGFEATTNEVLQTIHKASESKTLKFAAFKITGLASFDLLAKLHAGEILSAEDEAAWARVQERVQKICSLAHERCISFD